VYNDNSKDNKDRNDVNNVNDGKRKGMTTQERYDDICRISGLSEAIVRRVLLAEKESIVNSLRSGERATLIGRCVIRPRMRKKVVIGGNIENCVKLSVTATHSLRSALDDVKEFEVPQHGDSDNDEDIEGIMLSQIPSLV